MVVDGIKLLAMIKDKQIEKDKSDIYLICGNGETRLKLRWQYGMLRMIKDELRDDRELSMFDFMNYKFEVPEPVIEIDIQSIEELDEECYFINGLGYYRGTGEYEVVKQQNKIIKAIKQLDKDVNGNGEN